MKVALLLLDGMRGFDVCAALEVFGRDRTDRGVPRFDVVLVSPVPEPSLEDGARFPVRDVDAAHDCDLLIVPGFADPARCLVDAQTPANRDAVRLIRETCRRGADVASLCTGAFLLAHSGILDGTEATTHWAYCDALREGFPRIRVNPGILYTCDRDRRVWTSAGVAAGIDACLAMLAAAAGVGASAAVARSMVLPMVRGGGQAQYVPPRFRGRERSGADEEGLRTDLVARLAEPWTVPAMAARANSSVRTLYRRFLRDTGMTPLRWLNSQRVAAAQELLEHTDLAIEEIARRVGFADGASLRKHFAAELSVPPSVYRRSFRQPGNERRQ